MKLFYRIPPEKYREIMNQIRERFEMHEEEDEDKIILMLDDDSRIVKVTGSFMPGEDEVASVKVVLEDKSLRPDFDSILGSPFKIRK
ncbi:MAG: hypothetical protein ACFE7R_06555 [Candidatus Hodarchaeota archaeon]